MTESPVNSTIVIHVLLVDDQDSFRRSTAKRLELRGFSVTEAGDGVEADELLKRIVPDVVVCDLKMPNMDGITLLQKRVGDLPATSWLILTGQGSVDTAVLGLKLGAVDYLQKPIEIEDLEHQIRQAYEDNHPARMMQQIRQQLQDGSTRFGIVGRSRHIQDTYQFITRAARGDQPVLITGESGTGKELVARAVHEQSDRATRPFVTINCAALTDTLLANELFGHVEGAYTGAVGTKLGLFEVADGGTLFIDEIGDMSLQNQAAVLRIIETGQFRRLGDTRERVVDVRLVAATLCDLPQMVSQKKFREDLFYRLNVLPWQLLPLSERREDIPLLIQHFLDRHAKRTGQPRRLTPEALVALQAYDWPGNVREMANVIERAATFCDDYDIKVTHLGLGLPAGVATPEGMSSRLTDIERDHILRVLEAHQGNKLAAAKALGISRMKLYRKLEDYNVE
ncbi:MAG: Transcriptional regulatory protein ZraR [Phycisphaerae bacterium]|nr:Transcriptional regulatory protein ZraR [Phycisphaerae bacterium]